MVIALRRLHHRSPPVRLLPMIARHGRYWILLAGLPALILADPIPSGTDALTAYTRGDYKTAMKLLRPMAEEGNTFAQFTIGKMYAYGEGTPKDPKKGADL